MHTYTPTQAYLDQKVPPPVRYTLALTIKDKQTGGTLVLWKPVPPTRDFVALGMVATASREDEPPLDAVRCVPKAWACNVASPERVWQGGNGTVWRTRHNLLVGGKGGQLPLTYELARDQFSSNAPNPP